MLRLLAQSRSVLCCGMILVLGEWVRCHRHSRRRRLRLLRGGRLWVGAVPAFAEHRELVDGPSARQKGTRARALQGLGLAFGRGRRGTCKATMETAAV